MSSKIFLIGLFFTLAVTTSRAQETDTSAENPLKVLEGFVGKTWKGEVSPPGSEEKMYDLSRWEWTLGGHAIRIKHSVGEGVYSGETLMTWDHRANTIIYFYATTGGFFTRGTMRASETYFDATEIVVGNADGVVSVLSSGELLDDGTLQMISASRTRSGWMEADTTIYVVDPTAEVFLQGEEQ